MMYVLNLKKTKITLQKCIAVSGTITKEFIMHKPKVNFMLRLYSQMRHGRQAGVGCMHSGSGRLGHKPGIMPIAKTLAHLGNGLFWEMGSFGKWALLGSRSL